MEYENQLTSKEAEKAFKARCKNEFMYYGHGGRHRAVRDSDYDIVLLQILAGFMVMFFGLVPILIFSALYPRFKWIIFIISGLVMIPVIALIAAPIRSLTDIDKDRRIFVKEFLADEATAECRNRKKAANWLWKYVRRYTAKKGKTNGMYKYDRNWYERLAHILKWL